MVVNGFLGRKLRQSVATANHYHDPSFMTRQVSFDLCSFRSNSSTILTFFGGLQRPLVPLLPLRLFIALLRPIDT